MLKPTTRRLLLLRHAKSDWPAGIADRDRPLAARGRRDAPRMGAEMARRGLVPDLAVVSTAQRTRETWDLVLPCLGEVATVFESRIYEAQPEAILTVIRTTAPDVAVLLVIGHNPGLELTSLYLGGERRGGRARATLEEKFPTAALAVVEFEGDWSEISRGSGTVSLFLTPSDLETDEE